MRITDLLKACSVELNGTPQTKEETIEQMVALMEKGGNVTDVEKYKAGVFAREEEGTTGIGEGIAIPHAKTDAVNAPGLAAMVIPAGVDYDALDGQPVDLVFLIAAPNTEDNVHLEVLSRLSMLLMDESFKQNLLKAKTVEEFLAVVDRAENARNSSRGREGSECTGQWISCSGSDCMPDRDRSHIYGGRESGKYSKRAGLYDQS